MKLLIAIPCMDYMHFEFVKSLTNLILRLKNENVDFDISFISGTLVYVARDKLATKAISGNYTHVLWLDSDMVFSDNLLEELTFADKDFISGIYQTRRKPHCATTFKKIREDCVEMFEVYPEQTFEIEACGFGCVLHTVDILRKVKDKYDTCFLPMKSYGEDIAFCIRARECGFRLYAEPCARLGHIGHIVIDEHSHEEWKRSISNYPQED